jgi:hypothetical protein
MTLILNGTVGVSDVDGSAATVVAQLPLRQARPSEHKVLSSSPTRPLYNRTVSFRSSTN